MNIFNENIDSVHIERQLDFEEFSKLIDLSEEEIKELNPSYKIGIVPYVEERNFYINLPINTIEYFLANKDSIYQNLERNKKTKNLPSYEEMVKNKLQDKARRFCWENFTKFNCRIKDILLWNDMKNTKIIAGKYLKIYVNADFE